eukprot:Skav227666  [mRNA]  locus=scaffold58:634807:635572:- [translate_table: standard]
MRRELPVVFGVSPRLSQGALLFHLLCLPKFQMTFQAFEILSGLTLQGLASMPFLALRRGWCIPGNRASCLGGWWLVLAGYELLMVVLAVESGYYLLYMSGYSRGSWWLLVVTGG